jgi:hypothetical protein
MVGNGVATIVVARWEHELDTATLQKNMGLSFEAAIATESVAIAQPLVPASSTKVAEG